MAQCVITGTLVNVVGTPMAGEPIGFRVAQPANVVVFDASGRALGDEERLESTDEYGYFSVSLLQGLQVLVRIEALNLYRQVTVPARAAATLEEMLNGDL
jgi:hypothetical protein